MGALPKSYEINILPKSIEKKTDLFLRSINANDTAKNTLLDIFSYFNDKQETLQENKAERTDIGELIVEMRTGFKMMDKRFEAMDKRFEAMDKRFDDLIHQMDKRFESMDKRFESMDKRFDDLIHQMDKRFEAVDKRFEAVDRRFDDLIHHMDKRFVVFQWIMGIGFGTTFSAMAMIFGKLLLL